jgi:hypothetical protein
MVSKSCPPNKSMRKHMILTLRAGHMLTITWTGFIPLTCKIIALHIRCSAPAASVPWQTLCSQTLLRPLSMLLALARMRDSILLAVHKTSVAISVSNLSFQCFDADFESLPNNSLNGTDVQQIKCTCETLQYSRYLSIYTFVNWFKLKFAYRARWKCSPTSKACFWSRSSNPWAVKAPETNIRHARYDFTPPSPYQPKMNLSDNWQILTRFPSSLLAHPRNQEAVSIHRIYLCVWTAECDQVSLNQISEGSSLSASVDWSPREGHLGTMNVLLRFPVTRIRLRTCVVPVEPDLMPSV